MTLQKIISGGQTGVDRGALDAALAAGLPCGGWCPAGRKAEDGEIPEKYPVTPLRGGGLSAAHGEERRGQRWHGDPGTRGPHRRQAKPVLVIDALGVTQDEAAEAARRFVETHRIQVLNVAGPRASGWGFGESFARRVLGAVLQAPAVMDLR